MCVLLIQSNTIQLNTVLNSLNLVTPSWVWLLICNAKPKPDTALSTFSRRVSSATPDSRSMVTIIGTVMFLVLFLKDQRDAKHDSNDQ